jgi:hypothetical protein
MELSGFNVEPEWFDLISGELCHLQMIFNKLKAYLLAMANCKT